MKRKTTIILTTILCLAPILLGLYLYDQLPDMVPTHFDFHGEPDGWSSKPVAVFGMPLFMASLNLLCHWAYNYTRKKQNGKVAPDVLLNICYWIPAGISVIVMPMTFFMAIGVEMPLTELLNILLGVMFLVVGNYLPKCKMNAFIGIRLPWTYSSDENWRRTHRLGGFVWVICGALLLVNAVVKSLLLQMVSMFGAVIIPGVYSYLIYRKEKK